MIFLQLEASVMSYLVHMQKIGLTDPVADFSNVLSVVFVLVQARETWHSNEKYLWCEADFCGQLSSKLSGFFKMSR